MKYERIFCIVTFFNCGRVLNKPCKLLYLAIWGHLFIIHPLILCLSWEIMLSAIFFVRNISHQKTSIKPHIHNWMPIKNITLQAHCVEGFMFPFLHNKYKIERLMTQLSSWALILLRTWKGTSKHTWLSKNPELSCSLESKAQSKNSEKVKKINILSCVVEYIYCRKNCA